MDVNDSSDPAASFTDPQIWTMIDGRITDGKVPAPSNSTDRIYCVIMPTGHSSGDTPFVGQHQVANRNGVNVYWAWVTNDGTLTGGIPPRRSSVMRWPRPVPIQDSARASR